MNGETSWIEGKKKLIGTLVGMAVSIAVAFGISQTKIDTGVQIVTIVTPVLLSVIYSIFNQVAAKGKAATGVKMAEIESRTEIEVAKATGVTPEAVAASIPARVLSDPGTWAFPMYFPRDFVAYRQQIKDKVDTDLAMWVNLGKVAGINQEGRTVTKDMARQMVSELSSDNPSNVWTESQKQAMSIETPSNQAAIEFHKQILLPAAEAALLDTQQQAVGKRCNWRPQVMAEQWVAWCKEHISALEVMAKDGIYDFTGFKVWEAGEVAKTWVIDKVTWITTYDKGKEKNWKYPDKPDGYRF